MAQVETSRVEARLQEMGFQVPGVPVPQANYVPWSRVGTVVYVAGQVPMKAGKVAFEGRVGDGVDLATAQDAARLCALNAVAVLRDAAAANGGSLDQVRIARVSVFVAAAPAFTEAHKVANGASDLLGEAFGESGVHARSAVAVAALPLGVPVEVEVIAELVGVEPAGPVRAGGEA